MRVLITVDVCKVVDSVADIFERQAKERQIEAGKEHGRGAEKVVALVPQAIIVEPEEEQVQAIGVLNACPCRKNVGNVGKCRKDFLHHKTVINH